MKINPVVVAKVESLRATAALKVETLVSRHRQTPNIIRSSDTRLKLMRQITEARSMLAGWEFVCEALAAEADGDDVDGVPE